MIVIGSMNWPWTVDRGLFHCPNCNETTNYIHRKSRTFLTLYFIPVIPISGVQEYVQCQRCGQGYHPEVLNQPPPNSGGSSGNNPGGPIDFSLELLRVIALIMAEDGRISEHEESVATRVYEGITQANLTVEKLQAIYRQASALPMSTQEYLATVADKLTYDQKLLIVQAMFSVAGADGHISEGRLKSLLESRDVLQLDNTAFQQAVSDASQWLG